jgi:membrane dipeptidase
VKMPTVFDGHNDTLLRLYRAGRKAEAEFFTGSEGGHIDMPRARKGGFGGGFFAIFVPAPQVEGADPALANLDDDTLPPPLELAYSQQVATEMMALLFRLEAASRGKVKVVRTAADLSDCLENSEMAAITHFEGAEAIDPGLESLEAFYRDGLRSLGLVWSRPNAFAEGVPFKFPNNPDTGPGLTGAGRALVKECNRLGIMIDLSHLNERGFWDVARLSKAPLVATHSNAHAICPSARNLTDKQLAAIRESDGMVGVNLATIFLREDGKKEPDTPLDVVVRHVNYLVERLGIDRVGFGSDFDGATMPAEIRDVAGLPRLFDALKAHGYDGPSLRKLANENWLRVLSKTWKP